MYVSPERQCSVVHCTAVMYCLSNQRDSFGVHLTIDDVLDVGDSGSDQQTVKMISDSQVFVLNAGESVVLECYFTAAKYNMFDYPLLWKKVFFCMHYAPLAVFELYENNSGRGRPPAVRMAVSYLPRNPR